MTKYICPWTRPWSVAMRFGHRRMGCFLRRGCMTVWLLKSYVPTTRLPRHSTICGDYLWLTFTANATFEEPENLSGLASYVPTPKCLTWFTSVCSGHTRKYRQFTFEIMKTVYQEFCLRWRLHFERTMYLRMVGGNYRSCPCLFSRERFSDVILTLLSLFDAI